MFVSTAGGDLSYDTSDFPGSNDYENTDLSGKICIWHHLRPLKWSMAARLYGLHWKGTDTKMDIRLTGMSTCFKQFFHLSKLISTANNCVSFRTQRLRRLQQRRKAFDADASQPSRNHELHLSSVSGPKLKWAIPVKVIREIDAPYLIPLETHPFSSSSMAIIWE